MNNRFRDFSAQEVKILLDAFNRTPILLLAAKDQQAAAGLKEELKEWTPEQEKLIDLCLN